MYTQQRHHKLPRYAGTLEDDQVAVIDAVLDFYGTMTSYELIALTHADQPWRDARGDLPPRAGSAVPMNDTSIRLLYSARAINGEDGPALQLSASTVPDDVAAAASARVVSRWKTALDLLATR